MARAMAYPMAYPMVHHKFCNITKILYREKITTYMHRDQALKIGAIAALFFSNSSPKVS